MYNLNLTYPADQWIHRGEQISDFMSRLLDLYLLFYLLFINLKKKNDKEEKPYYLTVYRLFQNF